MIPTIGGVLYLLLILFLVSGGAHWMVNRFYFQKPKVKAARDAAELRETEEWLAQIKSAE